jgi:hypothetical protein
MSKWSLTFSWREGDIMGVKAVGYAKTLTDLRDSRLLYGRKMPAFCSFMVILVAFLLVGIFAWSVTTTKAYVVVCNGVVESDGKGYIIANSRPMYESIRTNRNFP